MFCLLCVAALYRLDKFWGSLLDAARLSPCPRSTNCTANPISAYCLLLRGCTSLGHPCGTWRWRTYTIRVSVGEKVPSQATWRSWHRFIVRCLHSAVNPRLCGPDDQLVHVCKRLQVTWPNPWFVTVCVGTSS